MKRKKKQILGTVFFTFSALLLAVVIILFSLALRQGIRYNRVLAEYEASRLSAHLTELYLADQGVNLDDFEGKVLGFAVYDEYGEPVFRTGETPEKAVPPHPGAFGEIMQRNGDRITVARTSGRGRMRQERTTGPASENRVTTLLVYDRKALDGTVSLMLVLTVLLFIVFIALIIGIAFMYRRINRIKDAENRNLRLIRLGQAARVLTHEIRNPLGSIRIQEKILKKKLPEEFQPSLAVIGEETARIARLSDRVGDFLKNPGGSPEETDLASVVRELVETAYTTVDLDIRTGPAAVFIDRDNLKSVLDNIIGNALQSGGDEKGVSITLEKVKNGFNLSVTDRGPGVPPGDEERIFDLFYTTRTRGSGIGLAVAKAFLEAAGGSISVRNHPGGGAVFTAFLPEYRNT